MWPLLCSTRQTQSFWFSPDLICSSSLISVLALFWSPLLAMPATLTATFPRLLGRGEHSSPGSRSQASCSSCSLLRSGPAAAFRQLKLSHRLFHLLFSYCTASFVDSLTFTPPLLHRTTRLSHKSYLPSPSVCPHPLPHSPHPGSFLFFELNCFILAYNTLQMPQIQQLPHPAPSPVPILWQPLRFIPFSSRMPSHP